MLAITAQAVGGLREMATAYRFVISIGSTWLAAKLAPQQPMKHAVMLLAILQCRLGGRLYLIRSSR